MGIYTIPVLLLYFLWSGSKRCFLNSLETSSKLGLCPPFIGHLPACLSSLGGPCRSTKTPWQRRTDRARGRQPMVPNVAF